MITPPILGAEARFDLSLYKRDQIHIPHTPDLLSVYPPARQHTSHRDAHRCDSPPKTWMARGLAIGHRVCSLGRVARSCITVCSRLGRRLGRGYSRVHFRNLSSSAGVYFLLLIVVIVSLVVVAVEVMLSEVSIRSGWRPVG